MSPRGVVLCVVALAIAGCAADGARGSGSTLPPDSVATTAAPDTSAAATSTSTVVAADEWADASSLAAALSEIEAGIRAPGATAAELADLGRRQQLAYRTVNRNPEWHAELLELVDPVAVGPLTHHLVARQAQVDHAAGQAPGEPVTEIPAWTIVAPLAADELRGYYAEAEAATGVPWQFLAAIHFQETRMGRVVGVSSAGAVGPMQFLPSTWAQCCAGDPTVARDAILGAAHYLVLRGAPADMRAALYGYNPNNGYVGAVMAYAQNMIDDVRAYLGYHGWEVFFASSLGTVRLPVGFAAAQPIAVEAYVRDHPDDLLPAP